MEFTIAVNSVPFTEATDVGVSIRKALVLPSEAILLIKVPFSIFKVRLDSESTNSNSVFSLTFMTDRSSMNTTTANPSSPTFRASPLLIAAPGAAASEKSVPPNLLMVTSPWAFMTRAMDSAIVNPVIRLMTIKPVIIFFIRILS